MSNVQAMSDDQVASELKKMTAFIRQEALEKAREIQIKADEEFAIEKSKLVRAETSSIDTQYEKKFKQASMSQQITRSLVSNKSRLRILSARQELLDELFEKAQGKLNDVTKSGGGGEGGKGKGKGKGESDASSYQSILKGLMLEGCYALEESKVAVRARKADYEVVKKAIPGAQKEYKDNLDKEVTIEIDEKNPLPEDAAGGVFIVGGHGKIDINNTFEERLHILELEGLPSIRAQLFGENENRKFKD